MVHACIQKDAELCQQWTMDIFLKFLVMFHLYYMNAKASRIACTFWRLQSSLFIRDLKTNWNVKALGRECNHIWALHSINEIKIACVVA